MRDKEQTAIQRLREASEMSLFRYKRPIVIADSGGKDSSVCKALALRAGIPFEVEHNHTTADAPETVYFVRREFARLEARVVRWCCCILKERSCQGRFVVTGVRWAESVRRKNSRGIYEKSAVNPARRIILTNDNDEKRRLFESCTLKAKFICNPIIDWTDSDVWDFLLSEKIPHNPLYGEGMRRVGCIACPMAGKSRKWELARWPAYERNFLTADAMHRQRGMRPLLKDYHALVIDEAHKLAETAQQMYGESFSFHEVDELCALLVQGHCERMAQRLHMAGNMLAESMRAAKKENGTEISEQKYASSPDIETALNTLIVLLRKAKNPVYSLPYSTICALERAAGVLTLFSGASEEKETKRLLYIRYGYGGEMTLCAACQETPALLERDLWRQTGAAILTSGTLAAGRSFVRTRQLTGLEHHARCTEFTVQSPFDYEQNCLLYLPPDTPNQAGKEHEAEYLSRRICELIQAVHGHALILFTSYISMSDVCRTLRESLPYPLVQAWKGNHQAIRQFKTMPNAILCAAGSCWEGIDLPGDMVSLLVITHLPFPVPTPVSEVEKGQYADLQSYIRAVIIPEMQTKLRQGVGRAIRTETDTCVVAILDRRAAPGGRYYTEVKQALPPCPVTDDMAEVQQFIRTKKSPEYFMS